MRTPRRPRTLLGICAAGTALFAAGCGGGGGSADELAGLVPSDAPIYVQAAVNPQGELRTSVDAAVKRIAGIDNGVETAFEAIDGELENSGAPISFGEDIEPWLGENAAFYMSAFPNDETGEEALIAGAVETTDTDAAQEAIDGLAEGGGGEIHDEEHGGVTYKTDGGVSLGIVDGFLVASNTQEGFEAVIDASNGDSLADSDSYQDAIAAAPDGSLADVYISVGDFLDAVKDRVDPSTLDALNTLVGDVEGQSVLGSLVPGSDRIEISFATNAHGDSEPGDAADTLGSLPADALAAVAIPDLGKSLTRLIDQLDSEGIPGQLEPGQLREQAQALGIDLDKIAGSLGDVGILATGTNLNDIGGAAVIETTDGGSIGQLIDQFASLAAASGQAPIRPLRGGLNGYSIEIPDTLNQPLILLTAPDRVVVGIGLDAARQALSGSGRRLSSNPVFTEASTALGPGLSPSLFVDLAPVIRLIETSGTASAVGSAEVLPYLERLTYLVLGAGTEGDLGVAKAIIGLGS
jgi:uncharacterized protein DUF3352